MVLPSSTYGKIFTLLFLLYLVALNPPVVTAVSRGPLVAGFAPLYLWFVGWGVFVSLLLVWAAHRNAFGLSDEQVPPEIGATEETTLSPGLDVDDGEVD